MGTRSRDGRRDRAIELLKLRHGARVVDVSCGEGENLSRLRDAVGESGLVVALEDDEEARRRAGALLHRQAWGNVELYETAAARAVWAPPADAALLAYAGDLTLDPDAVLNVLRQLRPFARVVSLERLEEPPADGPIGPGRPWRLLATYLADFTIEPAGSGSYIAHGHIPPSSVRPGDGSASRAVGETI